MLSTIIAVVILGAPVDPAPVKVSRLAAHIVRVQPLARAYSVELARRIFVESAAFGLDPAIMAAIAWIESDYKTGARNSRDGSYGLWQLMARDSYMSRAWASLQRAGRTTGYPRRTWWGLGARLRRRAMRDVRISTYMAHYEIREALRICVRMGHRVSRWAPEHRPRRFHRSQLERYGHFQSGNKWPNRWYVWRIRTRMKIIRAALSGRQ